MAVAVLGVGVDGNMLLAVAPQRVVLLGDVLGEIGSNHLVQLPRHVFVHEGVGVICGVVVVLLVVSSLAHASREAVVVVAKQQGGVGVGERRSNRVIGGSWQLGAPGHAAPLWTGRSGALLI